jgi:crotonobetainyl-CoA:carnitine CoA-transferase CaiB-like acyl-CoA transferase
LLLADLGANVILVERPRGGDAGRTFPDFFVSLGRNKRSVTLDLKSAEDKEKFYELVRHADVVLEGYAPGTAARLGIDYETLTSKNPGLIYASVSAFGQNGPYRDRAAHDISIQALAGLLADQAETPGTTPALPLGDIAAAMFAALAISSALYARKSGGDGTYIDVSLAEGLVSWMTPWIVPAMNNGKQLDVAESPAYGTFACADGRVLTLSLAHEDHFWKKLCEVLGLSAFTELSHAERVGDTTKLRKLIAQRIQEAPLSQWQVALDDSRIPWSPVNTVAEVGVDPHFRQRRLIEQITAGGEQGEQHVRLPVFFSNYGRPDLSPAPGLGQHNAEILNEAHLQRI